MLQTLSSTKPINNNPSIDFAKDNFLLPNRFLLKTKTPNLPQNISSSFTFKNNPSSALNALSLFLPSVAWLEENSRRGLFRFAPKPVLAKFERQKNANSIFSENGVRVFLTPEPKNMILNVGNNLNVESKQTQEDSTSSGFGFNVGVGVGLERQSFSSDKTTQNGRFERTASLSDSETRVGGGVSVSGGFNISNSEMTRTWTDNITTLTATGAMQINTGLNNVNAGEAGSPLLLGGSESLRSKTMGCKGNLNLTGAAILSDDMTLNVAGNINKTDLQDKYYSESMGFGIQVNNIGVGNVGGGG